MTLLEFNSHLSSVSKVLKPFALRLTKDVDDAKDLLQETLIKAYTNREKFSDGTNLKAWMYTIMKNTFITNYQRLARKKTFVDSTDNLHFINAPNYVTHNEGLSSFIMADIRKVMDQLDETLRMPFEMFYRGFKYHEISDKLSIPIGTVKNRIHIARKEMQSQLGVYR